MLRRLRESGTSLTRRAFRSEGSLPKWRLFCAARESPPSPPTWIRVTLSSSSTACPNEVLTTKSINIPYYNAYSTRDECKGLEEFNICMTNSNTEGITEEQFLEQIKQAKQKQAEEKNKGTKKEEKKEKTQLEKVISFYMDNKLITIPVTILIIGIIVVLIIRSVKNRKKKIKVDIGGL